MNPRKPCSTNAFCIQARRTISGVVHMVQLFQEFLFKNKCWEKKTVIAKTNCNKYYLLVTT